MAKETFYLGSTGFAQVGQEHYKAKNLIEKDVLMEFLTKKFGSRIAASGGRLVWAAHSHDFGTYHEMEFHVPAEIFEKKEDQIMRLVNDMEGIEWESEELMSEMERRWINSIPAGKQEVVNTLKDIGEATRKIEEHGGVVILPDNTEEALENIGKMQDQVHKMDTYKSLDIMEYSINQLNDSVVPACCVYGCEVEPDGHCQHGNPSILIDAGMI